MSDQIAKEDITEVNDLGQTVVLVAKGQPIPENLATEQKAVAKAPENKARTSSSKKRK